jgi:hypothetical protein
MKLEVKKWPHSQDIMDDPDWFPVGAVDGERDFLGPSAYAKILDGDTVATEALKFLAGHPTASLNYQFVATEALKEMGELEDEE